jgi:hypothetical protein
MLSKQFSNPNRFARPLFSGGFTPPVGQPVPRVICLAPPSICAGKITEESYPAHFAGYGTESEDPGHVR